MFSATLAVFAFSVSSVGAAVDGSDAYAQAVLEDEPVAYYRFAADDLTADAGSNGLTLEKQGDVSAEQVDLDLGSGNTAARFNEGHLVIPMAIRDQLEGAEAVSVSAWVKVDGDANGRNSVLYLPLRGGAAAIGLNLQKKGNGWFLYAGARSQAYDKFGGGRVKVKSEGWTHVVFVADLKDNEVRLYADGDAQKPVEAEYKLDALSFKAGETDEQNMIGLDASKTPAYLDGWIDELAIFAKAIDDPDGDGDDSDSRVQAHLDAAESGE